MSATTPPISKTSTTVYSWVMPETERLLTELATNPEHQTAMRELERAAWTKRQDSVHYAFAEQWREWVSPAINLPMSLLECDLTLPSTPWHFYPTAGSSEAIRESLHELAQISSYSLTVGPPTIHIFEGEYEGYEALGRPMGLRVIKHDRTQWRESLKPYEGDLGAGHVFYLSQPSSLDGEWWGDFDDFVAYLSHHPMRLRLDLCYVGCVSSGTLPFLAARTVPEDVDMIFFSLSKVFGVYYHRIGGVFSSRPMPGLWGNRWFKNLRSLYLGQQLMAAHGVFELPDRYSELQRTVTSMLHQGIPNNLSFHCADVFLLANQLPHARNPVYCSSYQRTNRIARYCLTQLMDEEARKRGLYDMP